jgi:uncharacterized protein (DUF1015 family)
MAIIKPFKALRPLPEYASKVAALPYDVMNRKEATEMVDGNPYSFLHVDKAEIDLPDLEDTYLPAVYEKARKNLDSLIEQGALAQDAIPCYYIYELTMDGRSQTGLVCCPSVDDYIENKIKKHELTRADKEADRIRHVDILDANTGPIFLAHRPTWALDKIVEQQIEQNEPIYDFCASDGVEHKIWVVNDNDVIGNITEIFDTIDALYIADGHHRCASAVRVARMRREENPDYTGAEEFNYFLAVVFPSDHLKIFDYNRVVKDLNGLSEVEFLAKISEKFIVEKLPALQAPNEPQTFTMFLEETWYRLSAKPGTWNDDDPVDKLDVSILQNNLLGPILAIDDPRRDKRIDFVGGIRGLEELERRASSDMKVAFAMYPTSVDELMEIADAGEIMPPKSTWFEPKLLSGLFIHKLK